MTLLRVVRGTPDDAELAALTAVVAGIASAPSSEEPVARSAWGSPERLISGLPRPGRNAWRHSALPR